MELEARKAVLYSIFDAGVRAVAPDAALMRHVCLEDGQLLVDGQSWKLPRRGRLLVLGAGKGVAPMGAAVEELLGDRIDTGMLVVKYGHGLPLQQIAQVEAAHPVPDAAGAAATRALLELAAGAAADDLVLCLLTGGASALTPAPVSGVTLEDMQQVTELLLRSGATITELNAVRKHLSRFSGGQLARTAAPAGVVSVIVSDVVGDALDVIASGPTAPDVSTFADCMDILARYGLGSAMPPAVLHHLRQGQLHQEAETPKPGDALFRHVQNTLVATNRQALDAAAEQARSHGFRPVILTDRMVGEAREQAALLVTQARQMAAELAADAQPVCLLAGGETTVTLRGRGRGDAIRKWRWRPAWPCRTARISAPCSPVRMVRMGPRMPPEAVPGPATWPLRGWSRRAVLWKKTTATRSCITAAPCCVPAPHGPMSWIWPFCWFGRKIYTKSFFFDAIT